MHKPIYLLKSLLLAIMALVGNAMNLWAQETIYIPENSHTFGVNAGLTLPYSDVQSPDFSSIVGLNAGYIPFRFLEISAQLQKGQLREGVNNTAATGMNYTNNFWAAGISLRLMPFQLSKQPSLKYSHYLNLYFGIGLSCIYSNVRSAEVPEYLHAGQIPFYRGSAVLIPLEVGYSFPLFTYFRIPVFTEVHRKRVLLQFQYRYNLSNSDKLDGYVPTIAANRNTDGFMQLTCGLAYLF